MILLICTVGGTPAPIVAALTAWKPARVIFVPTKQTRASIESETPGPNGRTNASIVGAANAAGIDLDPGRYDVCELTDGEDFEMCVQELRALTKQVEDWAQRGPEFRVVVDFTGGTKCMSAAIGVQATRWPCEFSYVGGHRRTKEGVGIVEPGSERVVHRANPWDALGYRAVEEFVVLFDQLAFRAAAQLAESTVRRVERGGRKKEFAALQKLAEGFDAWDRFDHDASAKTLKKLLTSGNDLRAALALDGMGGLDSHVERVVEHLDRLVASQPPSLDHVRDLLANARRRQTEGRFDDAVARLYRATEAIAQVRLKEAYGLASTAAIPLDAVPEPLRSVWVTRAQDGHLMLGLQDAYTLLEALGDDVGAKFQRLELVGKKSPLNARNSSILAHGFDRIGESVVQRLWSAALDLSGLDEDDLPFVPQLGASRGGA